MAAEKSLAIVLRLVEFSESSYIASLFTEDFGKISGLAKGARRRKSPFEAGLDLLAISRVVFLQKSSESLHLLTEVRLERPFRAGRRDLARLYAGYYVAELLQALTDDRDPHPSLFRAACQTLVALDEEGSVVQEILHFELSLLRHLGQLPSLHECVECGRSLADQGRIAFGLLTGGVMCDRCKLGKRQVVSLSGPALRALRTLARDDEQWTDLQLEPRTRGELRGVLNRYMSHLLGRRPKMYDYLGYWAR